ncbi:MAG: PQQ-binding-like beta-propeller repeat protein, partial [Planctomycetia bacterium]
MTTPAPRRFTALLIALVGSTASAEDWPNWNGPRFDGTWRGPRLADRWAPEDLPTAWSVPVGGGYSGLAVVDGLLYTLDRPEKTDKAKTPDGRERIFCLRAADGETVWSHDYPAHYGDLDYGNGPRCTPTVTGGRVYTLGAVGRVSALDAHTGKVLWSKDMVKDYGATTPTWGFAASPLLVDSPEGDLIVVHAGATPNGSLVAFRAADGAEAWRSLPDPAGYGTPILIDAPSGRQIVVWTPENVHGVEPATGRPLWSIPYKVTYGVSIATPLYRDGFVFVSGYWEGSKAIRLGPSPGDATLAWVENRNLRGLMAPPLHRDGCVFLLDKQHGMTCFDLATGEKRWDDANKLTPKDRNPQASYVWLDDGSQETDRVLALNSEGELVLARLTKEKYVELARRKIVGPTWAGPAFAGYRIYARTDDAV